MEKRILLVEDEEVLRANLKEILELNDFEVVEFSNGEDALSFLLKNSVDLIISDLMMPRMDGHDFLRKIKADPYLEKTPFILLSAKIEVQDKDLSMELGADLYLTKPIKTYDLIKSIQSIL
ncbi:response regulator [Belliella sp. R4-6]|uniref:Response regulator n=1 Tax=Belliella alkalica TaxID=1730871 RepID=A0ABS9V6J4_9BACT|nr:response regulator [Belliella alkalica]MCH7412031.1 response regulator [Belliella alkalica]